MPADFPTRRTGRAALVVARLVLGLAVLFVFALGVSSVFTSGAAIVMLIFCGPLVAVVAIDDRRVARRVEQDRRERMAAAARREAAR